MFHIVCVEMNRDLTLPGNGTNDPGEIREIQNDQIRSSGHMFFQNTGQIPVDEIVELSLSPIGDHADTPVRINGSRCCFLRPGREQKDLTAFGHKHLADPVDPACPTIGNGIHRVWRYDEYSFLFGRHAEKSLTRVKRAGQYPVWGQSRADKRLETLHPSGYTIFQSTQWPFER
jgi:hypothetical protein